MAIALRRGVPAAGGARPEACGQRQHVHVAQDGAVAEPSKDEERVAAVPHRAVPLPPGRPLLLTHAAGALSRCRSGARQASTLRGAPPEPLPWQSWACQGPVQAAHTGRQAKQSRRHARSTHTGRRTPKVSTGAQARVSGSQRNTSPLGRRAPAPPKRMMPCCPTAVRLCPATPGGLPAAFLGHFHVPRSAPARGSLLAGSRHAWSRGALRAHDAHLSRTDRCAAGTCGPACRRRCRPCCARCTPHGPPSPGAHPHGRRAAGEEGARCFGLHTREQLERSGFRGRGPPVTISPARVRAPRSKLKALPWACMPGPSPPKMYRRSPTAVCAWPQRGEGSAPTGQGWSTSAERGTSRSSTAWRQCSGRLSGSRSWMGALVLGRLSACAR